VGPITKIADFVPVLQEHVKKQGIKRGEWIIGYGYDRSNLAEGRELLATELDPAFADNPVMLIHSSNHGAVLNSAAFEAVGYDENIPTPPGGVINRVEGTNKPAGFIMETAFLPIFGSMPQPSERELLDTLEEAQQLYASVGVTTCQEGATHAKDLVFLRKGADKGIQVFSHRNGDAAIDMMIDGARAAGVTADQDRRTVIIHSQCMRRDQLRQYAEFGFSPSFFTVHTFFWGEEHMANLGPERASFISPMKSAIDKGLICSNHSDFSVTPMDPMRMTWSAVTRQSRGRKVIGPDERIDRCESLKALTINAAWQLREEDQKGTIAAGKLADLVILDANPLTVETDRILDIKAVEIFKDGNSGYKRLAA